MLSRARRQCLLRVLLHTGNVFRVYAADKGVVVHQGCPFDTEESRRISSDQRTTPVRTSLFRTAYARATF